MTYPAPKYLKDDPWFRPAVISDANRDYMEKETQLRLALEPVQSKEPDNIHQLMYQIATESRKHTLAWYDVGNLGGSETFQ